MHKNYDIDFFLCKNSVFPNITKKNFQTKLSKVVILMQKNSENQTIKTLLFRIMKEEFFGENPPQLRGKAVRAIFFFHIWQKWKCGILQK